MSESKWKARQRAYPKKDTGIATLPNGVRLAEETRDQLQKHHWQGPRREVDPNDPNNWTTAQCRENRFSGFRANQLSRQMEIWVVGHIEKTIPLDRCTPEVLASAHEEVFATNGTLAEISAVTPTAEGRDEQR